MPTTTGGTLTAFTAGDLVISISGDGDGSGTYADKQASPAVLQELTTTGTIVGTMVLPQQTTVVNGVTMELFLKGAVATNTTVEAGGSILVNGAAR